jgi:hypothetical protein
MPPALKAGVTDHLWTLDEMAAMIEENRRNRESNSN